MAATLKNIGKSTAAVMKTLIAPQVGHSSLCDVIGYIENAGLPTSVTPDFVGQRLFDTTNSQWYSATGTSSGNWVREVTSAAAVSSTIGAAAAQPASGSVAIAMEKIGSIVTMTITLTAARITVTDATTSGSSGSLQLFDFVQAGIQPLASRQNYTAFAEGAALTTGAGDAAHVLGLGSVAADAGDGALTGTEVNFAAVTGTITNSGGTGAGTKFAGSGTAIDGTGTAADLYLNWSGTAATIDATSTIDVTGTITLVLALLGDD